MSLRFSPNKFNTIRARSAFEKSLDIDYARDGEVMIAFAMNEPDEIEIAIQAALSLPRPALVEAVVDAETRPNRKRYGHSPRAGHLRQSQPYAQSSCRASRADGPLRCVH